MDGTASGSTFTLIQQLPIWGWETVMFISLAIWRVFILVIFVLLVWDYCHREISKFPKSVTEHIYKSNSKLVENILYNTFKYGKKSVLVSGSGGSGKRSLFACLKRKLETDYNGKCILVSIGAGTNNLSKSIISRIHFGIAWKDRLRYAKIIGVILDRLGFSFSLEDSGVYPLNYAQSYLEKARMRVVVFISGVSSINISGLLKTIDAFHSLGDSNHFSFIMFSEESKCLVEIQDLSFIVKYTLPDPGAIRSELHSLIQQSIAEVSGILSPSLFNIADTVLAIIPPISFTEIQQLGPTLKGAFQKLAETIREELRQQYAELIVLFAIMNVAFPFILPTFQKHYLEVFETINKDNPQNNFCRLQGPIAALEQNVRTLLGNEIHQKTWDLPSGGEMGKRDQCAVIIQQIVSMLNSPSGPHSTQ